jgi:hypothetical protein
MSTETRSNYQRLLEGVDSRWDTMRVVADAAEEDGQNDVATGLRWLAEHKKWSLTQIIDGETYHTWSREEKDGEHGEHYLPPGVLGRIHKYWPGYDPDDDEDGMASSVTCHNPHTLLEAAAKAVSEWLNHKPLHDEE